ncbi:FAD-dependent monooxygenase [Sciscionella sediminilitoris]|uniref:FAD-dependent monooxygenase n=1 Tax=Sciscionella sediminilitoris TaxID=1445613 RepID=UPI00055D4873|nr:FAD-dependent monooxygenase [Sciscionella sp. SE31]
MSQVLIAGAGPTGLTAAISLARAGCSVRIVDAAERPFNGSRGDGLQPRTLEVFDDLGVAPRVLAEGGPPLPTRVYVGGVLTGEQELFPMREPTAALPYPTGWFCPQFHTELILRERLAEFGVRVEFGTALTEFSQSPHGVSAVLVHNGQREEFEADYLIGADGGRSAVRKQLGIGFAGTTREDFRMLLGDVRAEGLDRSAAYWFAPSEDPMSGVALTPLPGTELFQFGAPLDRQVDEPGLEQLRDALAAAGGTAELSGLTWSTVWRPNIRMAERFRDGRVFLAGDAAHVHPPTGGQGLNTGVQDGYNLGWKLAAVLSGADPVLLDSYEAERLPIARQVLELSTGIMAKYENGEDDALERGEDVQQLGLGYRDSALSVQHGVPLGELRAGDRAPDGLLVTKHGERLFDALRGPHPLGLGFGVDVDALGQHAYRVDGELPHYAAGSGTVLVLRPDGYLGYVGTSVAEAAEYRRSIAPNS